MGKPKAPRRVAENEALSVGTQEPRVRPEAELVAGPDPQQEGRRGAEHPELLAQGRWLKEVRKVLASAIANAENNHNLDVDSLGRRRGPRSASRSR